MKINKAIKNIYKKTNVSKSLDSIQERVKVLKILGQGLLKSLKQNETSVMLGNGNCYLVHLTKTGTIAINRVKEEDNMGLGNVFFEEDEKKAG